VFRLGISGQTAQQVALGGTMIALPIYFHHRPSPGPGRDGRERVAAGAGRSEHGDRPGDVRADDPGRGTGDVMWKRTRDRE
jgi:hypothetical protein